MTPLRLVKLSFSSRTSSDMDGLYVPLVFLLGIISCSHNLVSGSMLEVTARPGDNITLYCDCKLSKRMSLMWIRNCSHENQPSLVLKSINHDQWKGIANLTPRFEFMKNNSSDSYDLLIKNITKADEGLYYCGTEELTKEDNNNGRVTYPFVYRYSNMTTRIILNSTDPHHGIHHDNHKTEQNCGVCWKLLFSLCPAVAVLSSLLSLLVYQLCHKTGKSQDDEKKHESRSQGKQAEDVCYAAVEIRQQSERPKRKKTQSSDFSGFGSLLTHVMYQRVK